ncbi:hypothetical protein [Auraticoccus monumenti]|uniref:Uncharacterized protein n=1 Tax=Auraticoccus monumenti TaxID=675864 RepID=A0A1G6UFN0_9ACTN|nr:hypothetical protein [Auraticoccus monumenti]SDD40172.1 hypothetical protein SAMN04489747_0874 [Auraticoccus monumenti]
MTNRHNGYESGTPGQPVTPENSGSTAPVFASAGTTYSDERAFHGSLSAHGSPTAGVLSSDRWLIDSDRLDVGVGLWLDTAATADFTMLRATQAADAVSTSVLLQATNRLRLNVKGNILWTATNPLPMSQWVWATLALRAGDSPTTGTAQIAYYVGESETPVEISQLFTGINVADATALLNFFRVGKQTAAATPTGFFWDDVQIRTGADAVGVRPYIAPAVPITGDTGPRLENGTTTSDWSRFGVATTDGAALSDAADNTGTESPDYTAVEQWEEYRLPAEFAPRDVLGFVIRASTVNPDGTPVNNPTGTVRVRLMQGTTQRQAWTLTQSGTPTDRTVMITNPRTLLGTDWTDLRLQVGVVA